MNTNERKAGIDMRKIRRQFRAVARDLRRIAERYGANDYSVATKVQEYSRRFTSRAKYGRIYRAAAIAEVDKS